MGAVLWNLFLQIVSGILGLWLAQKFIPGVDFTGPFFIFPQRGVAFGEYLGTLVFAGTILGFLNFFVKPILKKITLPLRVITFNLFSLVIAMVLVFVVEVLVPELIIQGIQAIFWTTLIVFGSNLILNQWLPEKSRHLNIDR